MSVPPTALRLYHGTDVDLRPGELIVPGPNVGRSNHPLSRTDRVHLTPYPQIARVFGSDFARAPLDAIVYEVAADDCVEHGQMRGEPAVEWLAGSATILRVVTDDEIDGWNGRYEEAEDLAQFWAEQGWAAAADCSG